MKPQPIFPNQYEAGRGEQYLTTVEEAWSPKGYRNSKIQNLSILMSQKAHKKCRSFVTTAHCFVILNARGEIKDMHLERNAFYVVYGGMYNRCGGKAMSISKS